MIDDLQRWGDSLATGSVLSQLLLVLLLFLAAMVANRIIRRILRRAYWRRAASGADRTRAEDLRRTKRQQTVLTVLESLNRYVVYGAATLVAIWVLFSGVRSAVFGASVVVVLVGFVFQRMLWDIVAGALLLFESRYGVGDYVHFHVQNVSGVVEEFGLRTTVVRTLAGDQVTILNGNITSFTRYANGYRDFTVRFTIADPDAPKSVGRLIERMGRPARPFLLGPHVERIEPATADPDEQSKDVELRAVVAPNYACLVEEGLRTAIERQFGEQLEGAVDIYEVDDRAFEGYRASILLDPLH